VRSLEDSDADISGLLSVKTLLAEQTVISFFCLFFFISSKCKFFFVPAGNLSLTHFLNQANSHQLIIG